MKGCKNRNSIKSIICFYLIKDSIFYEIIIIVFQFTQRAIENRFTCHAWHACPRLPTPALVVTNGNGKGLPQHAEVAEGVPGRLRPRIFLTFSSTRVVGHQSYAPAAFTPGEIPGTHFQRLSRPQSTWFCRGGATEKIPSDTTGNRSRDRPTSSAVP